MRVWRMRKKVRESEPDALFALEFSAKRGRRVIAERAPRHARVPKADQPHSSSWSEGKFMSRMRRESAGAMANPKATEKAVQTARILRMITPACPRACPATDLQEALRRRGYCPPWRTISKPVVPLNSCQKAPEKYLVRCLSLFGGASAWPSNRIRRESERVPPQT
jgi:hypothetical protein